MLRQELQPGSACGDPASAGALGRDGTLCATPRADDFFSGIASQAVAVSFSSDAQHFFSFILTRDSIFLLLVHERVSIFVAASFERCPGISAPSLPLESFSEKHPRECLVFLRRLSPR